MATRYVVGVDGGTTKTIALVADAQGHIRGFARGGGSNWTGEDVTVPMEVVASTTREAISTAKLIGQEIEMGVFSLAGADWPEDHTRRQIALEKAAIVQRVSVKNDSFGGLRAGTSTPYGVGIVSGTGSNTAIITPDGQEWAMGYYQNEGGAGHIAQLAFQAVLDADVGIIPPTVLTQAILEKLGYATPELMLRSYILGRVDWRKVIKTCPLVFEAAYQGDVVAQEILIKVATYLADHANAAIRRFKMEQLEFDVVLAGSLFKGIGPLYVDTITQLIHRTAPKAHIRRARFEPAIGAVLLAYDALKIQVTEEIYANLAKTAPEPHFFDTKETGYTEM